MKSRAVFLTHITAVLVSGLILPPSLNAGSFGTKGFTSSGSSSVSMPKSSGGAWQPARNAMAAHTASSSSSAGEVPAAVTSQSGFTLGNLPEQQKTNVLTQHQSDIRTKLTTQEFGMFHMNLPKEIKTFWKQEFKEEPKMWTGLQVKMIDNVKPEEGVLGFSQNNVLYMNSAALSNNALSSMVYLYERAIALKNYTPDQAKALTQKYAEWKISQADETTLNSGLKKDYEALLSEKIDPDIKVGIVNAFLARSVTLDNAYSYLTLDQASTQIFSGSDTPTVENTKSKTSYISGLSDADAVAVLSKIPDNENAYLTAHFILGQISKDSGGEEKAAKLLSQLPAEKTAKILNTNPSSKITSSGLVLEQFSDTQKSAEYYSALYKSVPAVAGEMTNNLISLGKEQEVVSMFNAMNVDDISGILNAAGKDTAGKIVPSLGNEKAPQVLLGLSSSVRSAALTDMSGNPETMKTISTWFKTMSSDDAAKILSSADNSFTSRILLGFDTTKAVDVVLKLDSSSRSTVLKDMVQDTASLQTVQSWFKAMKTEDATAIFNSADKQFTAKVLPGLDVNKAIEIMRKLDPAICSSVQEAMAQDTGTLATLTGWFKTMKTDEAAVMLNTAGKDTAIKVLSGFDTNKAVEIMLKLDANVRASVVTGMSEDSASLAVVTGWFKTMKPDDAAGILNVAGKDTAVKVLSGLDVNKAVDILGKVTPEIMNTVIADMAGNQDTLPVVTGWFKTMAPPKAAEILNTGSKEVTEKILSGLEANKAVDIVLGLSQDNRQAVISDMVSNPDMLKTAGEWLTKADKTKGIDLLVRLISEDSGNSDKGKSGISLALDLFVNVSDTKRQNELRKGVTDKFNTIKNSLISEKDTAKKESMQKTVDNFGKYTEQWNAIKKEAFFQLAAKEGNSYELTGDKLTKTQQVFTKTTDLWKSLFGKDFSWSPESIVIKGVDSKILSGSVFEDVTSLYDAKTNTLYVKDGVASMPDIWRERENAFLAQAGNNAAAEKKEIQVREKALLLMTDLGIDQQKLIDTSVKDAPGVRSVLEGIDQVGYDSFKAGVKNVGAAAITSMILDNPSYLGASLLDMDKTDNVTAGLLCTIMGSNPENINPGVDSAYTTFSRLNSGSQAEVFNGIVDYYYKEQSEIKDSAQKTQHEEKGLLRRMDGVAAFMQKFQSSSTVTGFIAKGDDERLIKVADLVKSNVANGIIQNAAKNYSKDLDGQIQKEADLLLKVKAENSGAIFGYFDTATQDKIVSQIGIQKTSPIMDGYYKASPSGANAYMARINLQTGIDIMKGMDKENVKKIFSSFNDKIAGSYIETMLTEDQQSNLVDVYNGNQDPKVLDASGNTAGTIRTATVVRGENNLPTGISLSDTEFYPLDYQSLQVEKSPQASITGKKVQATFNVVLSNNKEVLRQTAADKRAFSVYSELLPDKGRFYDHDFKEIVKNRIMDTPDKRPLAILVFAQYDNNGAISSKADIISSVISNGYRVMYYKADTDADAINSVKSAAQVGTSREQRANFIWFEGHGNLRSIRWGNGSGGSDYFNAADYNNMKQMGPSLENGGTVVVSACNGARRLDYDGTLCESMAELIADAFWQQAGHVYATDQESISLNHLEFYNGRVSGAVWNLLDNCDSSGSHCKIVGHPYNFDVSVRNMPNRITPATNI